MTFEVIISDRATRDIRDYARYIATDSRERSATWQRGLYEMILSLEEFPKRFAIADQLDPVDMTIRSFPYHSHIVFYRVIQDIRQVIVLRIWPGQMREPSQISLD